MDNEFYEYFVNKLENEWHNYEVGDYHISAISTSHKDLDPEEKTGPCLRNQFFDYKRNNPTPVVFEARKAGIFFVGNLWHKTVQKKYKKNHPQCDIEYALIIPITDDITVKGSIDILDRYAGFIIDVKTSAPYNMPGSVSDMRPQYYSQIMLYAYGYNNYMKSSLMADIHSVYAMYINKQNADTRLPMEWYDEAEAEALWNDFVARVKYLHECLVNDEPPIGEPHKYCRYCPDKEGCEEYEAHKKKKANKKKK